MKGKTLITCARMYWCVLRGVFIFSWQVMMVNVMRRCVLQMRLAWCFNSCFIIRKAATLWASGNQWLIWSKAYL